MAGIGCPIEGVYLSIELGEIIGQAIPLPIGEAALRLWNSHAKVKIASAGSLDVETPSIVARYVRGCVTIEIPPDAYFGIRILPRMKKDSRVVVIYSANLIVVGADVYASWNGYTERDVGGPTFAVISPARQPRLNHVFPLTTPAEGSL
jgi:hypothetical protein